MSYSPVRIIKHKLQQNFKCLMNKDILLTDKIRPRYCSIHAKQEKTVTLRKKNKNSDLKGILNKTTVRFFVIYYQHTYWCEKQTNKQKLGRSPVGFLICTKENFPTDRVDLSTKFSSVSVNINSYTFLITLIFEHLACSSVLWAEDIDSLKCNKREKRLFLLFLIYRWGSRRRD